MFNPGRRLSSCDDPAKLKTMDSDIKTMKHILYISELDFGDSLKILTCQQCNRSLSVEADENGYLNWPTVKIINQGDFWVHHHYGSAGPNESVGLSVGVT